MNKDEYIKALSSALKVDKKTKKKIIADISFDISKRLSDGETMEEITADIGQPASLAQEFNSQLVKKKDIMNIVLSVMGALSFCVLLAFGIKYAFEKIIFNSASHSIGIIGGADGPTEIYVSASPILTYQQTMLVICASFFLLSVIAFVCVIVRKKKKGE